MQLYEKRIMENSMLVNDRSVRPRPFKRKYVYCLLVVENGNDRNQFQPFRCKLGSTYSIPGAMQESLVEMLRKVPDWLYNETLSQEEIYDLSWLPRPEDVEAAYSTANNWYL